MLKKYYIFILFLISVESTVRCQVNCLFREDINCNLDSRIKKVEACIKTIKGDTDSYVRSACHLSVLYCKNFQYIKAQKLLNSLLIDLKGRRHNTLRGIVYNNLGNCFKLSGEMALALNNYLRASKLFEIENNYSSLVSINIDLAEYYRSIGYYSKAKRYITNAYLNYNKNKLNDTACLIRLYNRIAAITNESSNSDSCLTFSLKAIELSRKINDLNSEAISLNEIGFAMKNRQKVDSALKCYQSAINNWTKLGLDRDIIHGKYNIVMLLSHNEFSVNKVIGLYKEIINDVTEKNIDYPLDQVYFGLSDTYYFSGDSLNCYRTRQKAYKALLEKNQKKFESEIHNITEKYENQKYQQQISAVAKELNISQKLLTQKNRENKIIYFYLIILCVFLVVIFLLLRRNYMANNSLKIKNKEKDVLIQEIHHRVKNNLQFVSSLINMQINSSKTNLEIESLNDTSRRIRSMALVHEMLYSHNNTDRIEIKKYIEELVSSINDIINSRKIPVTFAIECEEHLFASPTAIALGMITSELVSNSIKHAFFGIKNPEIKIILTKNEDGYFTYIVMDNGRGMQESYNDLPEKLGMRLISIFSRQIKGTYTLVNDNGLVYSLRFQNN